MRLNPKKLEFDIKHRESPSAKTYIEEAPKLELKPLPPHLRYVFWGKGYTFLVIIAWDLNGDSGVSCRGVEEVQTSHWLNYCEHYWDSTEYLLKQINLMPDH